MSKEEVREAVEAAQRPLVERLDRLEARMKAVTRQRTLLGVVAFLALVVAVTAIGYGINRENALEDQVEVNRIIVCASAKATALFPRQRPLAGETRDRYLNRMVTQREQLLAVRDLRCPSLRGFATFPYLRARALEEIESILRRLAPKKLRRALDERADDAALPMEEIITPSVTAAVGGTAGEGNPPPPRQPPTDRGEGTPPDKPDAAPPKERPPPDDGRSDDTGSGGEESGGNLPADGGSEPPPSPPPVAEAPPPEKAEPTLLDPALGIVCEVTAGLKLCTPR